MRQQWQFEQDDQSRWRWKRLDDKRGDVDSAASFTNAAACMLDAVRYAVRQRRSQPVGGLDDFLQ